MRVPSNELIDGNKLKGSADVTFSHGLNFGILPVILGFVFMIIGVAMINSLMIIGILLGVTAFFAGSILSTSMSGVQVDYTHSLYREYTTYFFIKFGKWKSLNYFPYITVLKANKSTGATHTTGLNQSSTIKESLGIYLLNRTHRKCVLVKRCTTNNCKEEAQQWAQKIEKEVVRFNPKVNRNR